MALANFIQRALTAASQVLAHYEPEAFVGTLESSVVGLAFDAAAARSTEAKVTLSLSANLLARLYPRIALVPLGRGGRDLVNHLASAVRQINPDIDITTDMPDACLVVGQTPIPDVKMAVYVGSRGWVVQLSPRAPAGSGASRNPFGAAATACFGVANIFRAMFAEQLPVGDLDEPFSVSLLDFEPNGRRPENPPFIPPDIDESHLVGVGAIGNAAVWTLAHVPELRGTLHLIDDELVDLGNLQRYVLTTQADVGKRKVALAEEPLRRTQLNAKPHYKTWAAYLKDRADWKLARVAVALDSAPDRIAVQAALPRSIINSWTQTGDLGVSRHAFVGDAACLACLYLPDGKRSDLSQLIADAIGMPTEKQEIGRLLHTNAPLQQDFIRRIAEVKQIPLERLLPFEGKPLRIFYSEAICGGAVLQFNERNGQASRTEVPMAFQSALAGVLLASELVAEAGQIRRVPPATVTTFDLMRPLGSYLSFPRKKDRDGRCICQDPDYAAAFLSKYGADPA